MPILISFSGLPGVGKTTIARALAERIGAVYIRVDEIEAALRRSTLQIEAPEDAGYLAASAITRSNLELGRTVIADTVNPVSASRDLWAGTAKMGGGDLFDIEVVCTDKAEHRRRVDTREGDIEGYPLPDWARVEARDYDAWDKVDLRIDTAKFSPDAAVDMILAAIECQLNQD